MAKPLALFITGTAFQRPVAEHCVLGMERKQKCGAGYSHM